MDGLSSPVILSNKCALIGLLKSGLQTTPRESIYLNTFFNKVHISDNVHGNIKHTCFSALTKPSLCLPSTVGVCVPDGLMDVNPRLWCDIYVLYMASSHHCFQSKHLRGKK